jgi:Kef-type K+ transport system membrane component KefB
VASGRRSVRRCGSLRLPHPIFFVTSGLRFDLDALRNDPSTLALVPIFFVALLAVRGPPAVLYRSELGTPRSVVAASLLQATSLPFIVPASIGVDIGALTAGTASAFVGAGLVSAVPFPELSLSLLRPMMGGPDPSRSP